MNNAQVKTEIIQQRVVDSECGTDGCLSLAEWVPSNPHSGAEQLGRVIDGKGRLPYARILQHAVCIWNELGSTSVSLVPPIGKLMTKADPHGKIRAQLQVVLRIPCAFPLPPIHNSSI